ncbi:MAG TPA: sensor histidine kinase [Rhodanobacteraceae bacterium]
MQATLRQFLRPAPDSVWEMHTGIRERLFGKRPTRWIRFANLVWLLWFFGDLISGISLPTAWWPATALAFSSLIVLLWLAHVRPLRDTLWLGLAMVALGCAVMPINRFGSGTCLIYGCAFVAFQPTVRRVVAMVAAPAAVWVLEAALLHWPWQPIVWVTLIACCVAFGQHSAWTIWRRNAEVRLSHDEVRRLAASAERERIGRDLHDLLGHTLSMVALKSELAERLIERDPGTAKREMAEVARVAREALAQVRSAVSGIRAAALASELASARLLLETAGVHVDYFNDGQELPPDVETCLAMVLREAVTNIHRHARANNVEVSVIAGVERAVMRVRDDGRGGVGAYGNGLTGMRERISARGGEIWIDSPQGKGTVLEVRLPLPRVPVGAERQKVVPIAAAQHMGGRA